MRKSSFASSQVLERVSNTTLYKSTQPGPGEVMLFLRWSQVSPPLTLTLDSTWAATGVPSSPGYFVFLNQMPSSSRMAQFESDLRAQLTLPITSSFAWVKYTSQGTGSSAVIQTLVQVQLTADRPCLAANVTVALPAGMKSLSFVHGSPVIASMSGEAIDGFVIAYPPVAGSPPPNGNGVTLPMSGAAVGCIRFNGLVDSLLPVQGDSRRKTLLIVQIDPLRPVTPSRTFEILTGLDYILSKTSTGYTIAPAPSV